MQLSDMIRRDRRQCGRVIIHNWVIMGCRRSYMFYKYDFRPNISAQRCFYYSGNYHTGVIFHMTGFSIHNPEKAY